MTTSSSTETRELVEVEHALCPECGTVIEDHFSADLQIERKENQRLRRALASAERTISKFEKAGVSDGTVQDIFTLWVGLNGKNAKTTKLTPDRRKAITAAIKLYGEADVRKVIAQNAKTPYLVYTAWRTTGNRDSLRDLADILTKGKFFEGLLEMANTAPEIAWTDDRIAEAHSFLLSTEAVLNRIEEGKGWTARTLEELGVGLAEGRLIFPVRDAAGELIGVVKYHPRLRDSDKNQIKSKADGKRGLFPRPEDVDSDTIWLVEGESDAVTAHEMWLPAIAVPGASISPGDWMARLTGRKVVICFDCDHAGRQAANRIARPLTQYAAEVKVIDIDPTRTDGFDLTDWFTRGHSRKRLEEMARLAKPVSSVQTPSLLPQQTIATADTRFDRFVRALEERDLRPRERHGQWTALCPAHDDTVPTLHFSRGKTCPVVADCKAGCQWDQISEALNHPTRGKE